MLPGLQIRGLYIRSSTAEVDTYLFTIESIHCAMFMLSLTQKHDVKSDVMPLRISERW